MLPSYAFCASRRPYVQIRSAKARLTASVQMAKAVEVSDDQVLLSIHEIDTFVEE